MACFFFFHKWKIVEEFYGYLTRTTWNNSSPSVVHHGVFLEQCEKCGKKKLSATGSGHEKHHGIQRLRKILTS